MQYFVPEATEDPDSGEVGQQCIETLSEKLKQQEEERQKEGEKREKEGGKGGWVRQRHTEEGKRQRQGKRGVKERGNESGIEGDRQTDRHRRT